MTDKTRWRRRKSYQAGLSCLIFCCVAAEEVKAEFAYGLGYVAERSSNIARVPTNERAEWINSLIGGIAYRDVGPELATNVLAQAQANYYQNNTFDNQTLYFVDAAAIWTISPQRFTWTLEDHYTQALRDVRAAATPANRVGENVFDTGPDVYFRFGARNTWVVGGRYGQLYFADNDGDNTRVTGYTRWLYELSSTTIWSLNYEVTDVNFDQDTATNIDYARTDTYFRIETRPSRSHYTVDLGYTDIKRDRGPAVAKGTLARFTWLRELTSESSFSLSAAREYGDAGTVSLSGVTNPASPPPSSASTPSAEQVATADIFYAKRFEAAYADIGTDWGTNVQVFSRSFDYQITNQDRNENGGHGEITHNPAGLITTTLYGDIQKTEFLNFVREDDDRTIGIRLRYHAGRTLSFGVEGSKIQRSSTDPTAEYTDLRVLLGIYYSSGPLYEPGRR